MAEAPKVVMEVVGEKRWWQSKKFWIWLISFTGFGVGLAWALQAGADWKVSVALVAAMACVSMTGQLGQAFVDAAVRFAQAWKGGSPWADSSQG